MSPAQQRLCWHSASCRGQWTQLSYKWQHPAPGDGLSWSKGLHRGTGQSWENVSGPLPSHSLSPYWEVCALKWATEQGDTTAYRLKWIFSC